MNEYEHELATRAHEAKLQVFYMAEDVERERIRPFFLLRPRMFPDGNQWCALYGDNIQEGVAAFGDTPAKAAVQFDIEWLGAPAGMRHNVEFSGGAPLYGAASAGTQGYASADNNGERK